MRLGGIGQREGPRDRGPQLALSTSSAIAFIPARSASTSIRTALAPSRSASLPNSSEPTGRIDTTIPPGRSTRSEPMDVSPPSVSSTTSTSFTASVKSVVR